MRAEDKVFLSLVWLSKKIYDYKYLSTPNKSKDLLSYTDMLCMSKRKLSAFGIHIYFSLRNTSREKKKKNQ